MSGRKIKHVEMRAQYIHVIKAVGSKGALESAAPLMGTIGSLRKDGA